MGSVKYTGAQASKLSHLKAHWPVGHSDPDHTNVPMSTLFLATQQRSDFELRNYRTNSQASVLQVFGADFMFLHWLKNEEKKDYVAKIKTFGKYINK